MSAAASEATVSTTHRSRTPGRLLAYSLATGRRAVSAAMEHDALHLAQATAYSAMFALFPTLIVAAAVVSALPGSFSLRMQMSTFFGRILPTNVTPLLDAYFTRAGVHQHARGILTASVLVSVSGASGVMATLMEGFRRAHHLPLMQHNFWPRRLRALLLVFVSLVPMIAASLLVVFGHVITHLVAYEVGPHLRTPVVVAGFLLRWSVALAGSVAILAGVYHLGTDLTRGMAVRLSPLVAEPRTTNLRERLQTLREEWTFRASLPGAIAGTLMWFVSTLLFGWYVTRFANYSRVYGSLGAAIALMFWLFLIALSVLIGAEFNAQHTLAHRDPQLAELLWKLPGLRHKRTGRITD